MLTAVTVHITRWGWVRA